MSNINTICMIGLGYIGLPTAAVFSQNGIKVKGYDIDKHAVDTINSGGIHIEEPGLEELVKDSVEKGNFSAYTEPQPADAFIMAVPTPFKGDDHEPNIDYIEAATRSMAKVLKKNDLVILESTSPVGTTEKMSQWLSEERPDLTFPHTHGEDSDIRVTHCPERILPGQMIRELVDNDRIIGGITDKCSDMAIDLYKTFVKGECIKTSARVAEMSKLTENSFRDVNIAFANELSILCDKMGVDVWELIEMANKHPRVDILQPGCGVGGHCIAVDPWFIVNAHPEDAKIIKTARNINNYKSEWVIDKALDKANDLAQKLGRKPIVACMGLAFKPNIDDLRESPALFITKQLNASNDVDVIAVEPNVDSIDGLNLVHMDNAIESADLMVFLVAHKEFSFGMIDNELDFCGI